MQALSFTEKVRLEKEDLIVIYRGVDDSKQEFFAYIICENNGIAKMREDYQSKRSSKLDTYGRVIYIGNGTNPDKLAIAYLHDFVANYSHIKEFL